MWLAERQSSDGSVTVIDRLDLPRISFSYGDLVVAVDPDPHGVDSSRAEGERPRDLPDAPGAPLARRRLRERVLSRLLLVTLVAVWGVVLLVI